MWPAARRLLEYFEAVADDIGLSRPGAQIVELGALLVGENFTSHDSMA